MSTPNYYSVSETRLEMSYNSATPGAMTPYAPAATTAPTTALVPSGGNGVGAASFIATRPAPSPVLLPDGSNLMSAGKTPAEYIAQRDAIFEHEFVRRQTLLSQLTYVALVERVVDIVKRTEQEEPAHEIFLSNAERQIRSDARQANVLAKLTELRGCSPEQVRQIAIFTLCREDLMADRRYCDWVFQKKAEEQAKLDWSSDQTVQTLIALTALEVTVAAAPVAAAAPVVNHESRFDVNQDSDGFRMAEEAVRRRITTGRISSTNQLKRLNTMISKQTKLRGELAILEAQFYEVTLETAAWQAVVGETVDAIDEAATSAHRDWQDEMVEEREHGFTTTSSSTRRQTRSRRAKQVRRVPDAHEDDESSSDEDKDTRR
jgi:hypothetical protein